jgi:hypothetical protein
MFRRHAAVVAILGLVLAACGADADPSATTRSSPDPSSVVSVTASPLTAAASTDAVATPRPTPKPTAKPTPVPVPPRPTGARFHEDYKCLGLDCPRTRITQTALWRAPRTKGVEIQVFGVTECLSMPAHRKPGAEGPCLVEHTALPASARRLLATAPATAGWVSWSWKQGDGCGGPSSFNSRPGGPAYYAIVIAAYNVSGHSIFAIADPGHWYEPEAGDDYC